MQLQSRCPISATPRNLIGLVGGRHSLSGIARPEPLRSHSVAVTGQNAIGGGEIAGSKCVPARLTLRV
jgi:hypothetical protein